MTHPNVQPDPAPSEPSPWLDIADELEKIAHDLRSLVGEPAPACFNIIVQPRNPDPYHAHTVKNRPAIVAAVDAIALALLGKPSTDRRMSDGTYHRDASGNRGAVNVATYTSIADPAAVDPDEEIARLRAENDKLRAELGGEDPTGLTYGRDPEADPQPAAGRVPPHFESGRGAPFDEPVDRPGRDAGCPAHGFHPHEGHGGSCLDCDLCVGGH